MGLARFQNAVGDTLCSYNGFTFGPAANTVDFTMTNNYAPDGRTVMDTTYVLTIEDYRDGSATIDGNTDTYLEPAREQLSKNAGKLVYKGRGFGDITVNVAGQDKDVMWGPRPRSLQLFPLGNGGVVKFRWTVEWTQAACRDRRTEGVRSFTFKVGFDIDRSGYTTRRYESTLILAGTKRSATDKTVTLSADDYREQTVPSQPVGFRRESQSFDLSHDKLTLTTRIVDVQMPPNIPPKGCVQASFSHDYVTQGSAYRWAGTFAGEYEIERNGNPNDAVREFLATIERRRGDANLLVGAGMPATATLPGVAGKPVTWIPLSARASDVNVYDKMRVSLSLSYWFAGVGASAVFAQGGLWRPIQAPNPGANWSDWRISVPSLHDPRGSAGLKFDANSDRIVDLCAGPTPPAVGIKPVVPPRTSPGLVFGGAPQLILLGVLRAGLEKAFPRPRPADSWLALSSAVEVITDAGRVIGRTLPERVIPETTGGGVWDLFGAVPAAVNNAGSVFPPLRRELADGAGGSRTYVQQRVRPRVMFRFVGRALRAGYEIPIPELTSYEGKKLAIYGEPRFRTEVVYDAIGTPIVGASWDQTYVLTDYSTSGLYFTRTPPPPSALP